jgi:hypothetical protein
MVRRDLEGSTYRIPGGLSAALESNELPKTRNERGHRTLALYRDKGSVPTQEQLLVQRLLVRPLNNVPALDG